MYDSNLFANWGNNRNKDWYDPSASSLARQQTDPFVMLDRQHIDVTGDHIPDQVTLIGEKFSPDTVYLQKIYVHVVSRNTHPPLIVAFQGGYHPKMQFCDFNGDRVTDVLVSAETGGSAGTSDFYIASFRNRVPRKLPVPPSLTISGHFEDHYKVSMTIHPPNQTITLDLSNKKNSYEQAGYYHNGRLTNPTAIMPNTFSILEPVDVNGDSICELHGIQRVAGFFNADHIAYVHSIWKFIEDNWVLLDLSVQKA